MTKTSTYILTSKQFEGYVVFEFDADGLLSRFDSSEAVLNEEQRVWLLKRLPRHLEEVKEVLAKSKHAKLVKQQVKGVTFEMFWDKYDYKSRSSKKVARTRWKRLSQNDRDRAYAYIPVYLRSIPPGIAMKYAETYLSQELWNN